MDYSKILQYKYKGSEWSLIGEDYDGLNWLSDTPKPSKEELESQWDEVQELMEEKYQAELAAKAEAHKKLEALGLTVNDLKLLGLH